MSEAKAKGCLSFAPPRGGQGGKLTRIRARLGSYHHGRQHALEAHTLERAQEPYKGTHNAFER
ncbi:hypothetical protein HHE03_17440 [Helicobacter heilmannii]|nr:hypothetical protein HHE03_17440 [Helicobacter heilmannii]